MAEGTFEFTVEEHASLVKLRDAPVMTILFGIILYYPRERFSERATVEFFRRLAEAVPDPFADRRFRDVVNLLGSLDWGPGPIWSNWINGDPDGYRKHYELMQGRREGELELGHLDRHDLALRLLARHFMDHQAVFDPRRSAA
ncbi:MAG: hypothetical protein NUW08_00485 [Candidatus Uhrbacteria bacterium]|nr:hypothetical protein [Candidatus Uhrbacteria bacterium]